MSKPFYKPIKDNIVVKVTQRKTSIITDPAQYQNQERALKKSLDFKTDRYQIWAVGEDVKSVKPGDWVDMNNKAFYRELWLVDEVMGIKKEDNEFYLKCKEEDIIAIYEKKS